MQAELERRNVSTKKTRRQPDLYRGDSAEGVSVPAPRSPTKIVAHILYLDGPGRSTPFTSTTESRAVASTFAGRMGAVWGTSPPIAEEQGAAHISLKRLLADLKSTGKGECAWTDPWEVAQARVFVERSSEHLLDWRQVDERVIAQRVRATFAR